MTRESEDPDDRGMFARHWVMAQTIVAAFLHASVHNSADVEDLLQDVAAAAMIDFDKFDPEKSFTGWALGIARFRVLNYYRAQKRDRRIFSDESLIRLAEAHHNLQPKAEPYRDALEVCLAQLPERQRQMIERRYQDELSRSDIAEQFSMTPAALGMALHRIRQALAQCIEDRVSSEDRS